MSTTLTNGLKLPDKGSVDWYADMQNNYTILDGAVGTVAEHITQIAGKAPAVHTHTKADITDFPAYGTTAGTICEGNDSRLSDARTPVAHTHTKSDVTDLLNSNFIPSANNSYDLGSSSYQWKTLNGVNPGALSLPNYNRFEPIDFSQYDVNLGWNNSYTPSEDGWLYAEIDDTATNSIYIYSSGLQPVQNVNRKYGVSAQGSGSQSGYGGRLAVMIPVRKDIQYRFLIKASAVSDIFAVIFYPCLGNV